MIKESTVIHPTNVNIERLIVSPNQYTGPYDITSNSHLRDCLAECIELSRMMNTPVEIIYDEITIIAEPNNDIDELERYYDNQFRKG